MTPAGQQVTALQPDVTST